MKNHRNFLNNRTAMVTLWGIVFIGMAIYFVCWFTVGLPLVYFIDAMRVEMEPLLDDFGRSVVDTCMYAFEIHPAIALLSWFIYGILHSAKRENDVYRYS